ncbi:hypothetical protein NDK47_23745 [Brevibacillus ruminantium]|uniref:Uncharacterized protein n=1 Tax=Brevibacillus ruminantium TaxID=2950604 RepID=A0ABY4WD67_9BACL|nr:hypothetical protein [Brevibacillus ruminantium]USG65100.1 hypothetical protein NDK47_23745 [Brevibacillus ruminantium]
MMSFDWVNALALIVCFLVLVVTYKHIELQVRINNILDLQLKANKDNKQCEEKKENNEGEDHSPP